MLDLSNKIVGIDLGTTNSVISILQGANPIIITNKEGHRITPSVISFTLNNELLIGELAKRQSIINTENTFYSVKRLIGSKYNDIKHILKNISYKVLEDNNGKIKIYSSFLKKEFTPEEISSYILKKLIEDANSYLNEKINKAIITVPAYFNDSQRNATKDAGIIANLNIIRILNEPTAAALAYGLNKRKNEIILIFDLGGGTFDVSLLEVGDEVFEVLATSGDTFLGGDDFDKVIVDYIINEFNKKEKIDLSTDKQAFQRIIEASEKAKIELSILQKTNINIPFIYIDSKNNIVKHINIDLTRSKFEELSFNLLNRCIYPLEKILQDSNILKSNIDQVILVGGSTRIPSVKNILKNFLNKKNLNETVNPDEVVALGAAIQAGIISGEITDLILLDITPLSLGVETLGDIMTKIIPKNTSIPVNQSEYFSTTENNQNSVEINILQGEEILSKNNKSLGIFLLNNIPNYPSGVPKIKVTFKIDVNGILFVSAKEENSNKEQSILIKNSSILNRNEVNKIANNSNLNFKINKFKKILIKYKYELDDILYIYDIYQKNNKNIFLLLYIILINLFNNKNIFLLLNKLIKIIYFIEIYIYIKYIIYDNI